MTTRILLLGASGFVGRAIGNAVQDDDRVEQVIRVGSKSSAGVADGERAGWVTIDLLAASTSEIATLLRAIAPDVVVNAVGALAGPLDRLVAANVLATAKLVDAVAEASPGTRLLGIGSAAEYGVVPRGVPVSEDAPTRPVGAYGVTKLASTQLLELAAKEGRVEAVALRVFNPIGAGLPVENLLGRAAAGLRAALDTGADVLRLGPLGAYRDFVDVRDVADAVRAVALAPTLSDPVLNVGSGVAVTARDTVRRLADLAGFRGRIEESAAAPSRSAAVDWIAADTTRLRRYGWAAQHDLDSSLRAVWDAVAPAPART